MTTTDWRDHADRCRKVAETMHDATARRILLEAADDYCAMALREAAVSRLIVPAYRAAFAADTGRPLPR